MTGAHVPAAAPSAPPDTGRSPDADGSAGTALGPNAGTVWRAAKGPVLVAGLVLVVALVLALAAAGGRSGLLDPRAADRPGSQALAEVLRDQGVEIQLVQTTDSAVAAASTGSTLFLPFPGRLVSSQLQRVRDTGADLVVVAPTDPELSVLAPEVTAASGAETMPLEPACGLPAAQRAGTAELGGILYAASTPERGTAALCYATGGAAALVAVESGGRSVSVVGDPTPFTNDRLDEEGNAALTLGLLGAHPRLVWYLPSLADVPPGAQKSLAELVPDGVLYGAAQVFLGVVLLALWRARRLGPVVAEPLPVLVRASEAVEGRARLYRRAHARDRASDALRRAAVLRLVGPLGLPRAADPPAVVDAVARRTGRPTAEVGSILYGAAPPDDAALVRLADALDRIDREVRRQ